MFISKHITYKYLLCNIHFIFIHFANLRRRVYTSHSLLASLCPKIAEQSILWKTILAQADMSYSVWVYLLNAKNNDVRWGSILRQHVQFYKIVTWFTWSGKWWQYIHNFEQAVKIYTGQQCAKFIFSSIFPQFWWIVMRFCLLWCMKRVKSP